MKKLLLAACLVWAGVATSSAQQLTYDQVKTEVDRLRAEMATLLAAMDVPPPPPPPAIVVTVVPAGGNIQAAIDAAPTGSIVELTPLTTYVGTVTLKSTITLRGQMATLTGPSGGPALYVPPGTVDWAARDLVATTPWAESVVKVGDNSSTTQGTLDKIPARGVLTNITVPTHRGKRAFELHGTDLQLLNCEVADVWHPAVIDSQAIWIHNTPGRITVDGGQFAAGSENVLVGGDTVRIPGLYPADLTFRNLRLYKPVTWRTDGVSRGVKNLFELKAGERVTVENVVMENTWTDGQISFAIVITPRNGAGIKDVTFDRVTVRNVGAGMNLLGRNDTTTQGPTPFNTGNVLTKNSVFLIDSKAWGGVGLVAQLNGGGVTGDPTLRIGSVRFDNIYATTDNGYGRLIALVSRANVEALSVTGSRFMVPYYLGRGPVSSPDETPLVWFAALDVSGNTIGNATAVAKTQYPTNTWITTAEFQALPQN